MNKIKKLYQVCRIRFGKISAKELSHLCAIYIVFCEEPEKDCWMSLHSWQKLYREDCESLLKLYLKHHTADDGLFQIGWALENEFIRDAYLRSLCTRKIPLTYKEEVWILNCGEPGAMRCLRESLSANNEYKLVTSGNCKMIENYICGHALRDNCEAQLAISASDKENPERAERYRELLRRYFDWQDWYQSKFGHKIFSSFLAQWSLLDDERHNEDFIMSVVEQCDMDNVFLDNAIVKRMAYEKMPPQYLIWYLAHSYITDKELVAEILGKPLSEHLRDMIVISEQRRRIHEIIQNSLSLFSDDWSDQEWKVYWQSGDESGEQKYKEELLEYLQPRLKDGSVSPAMAAMVAARFPELAKDVQLNLARYEECITNRVLFMNPYTDLYHTDNALN